MREFPTDPVDAAILIETEGRSLGETEAYFFNPECEAILCDCVGVLAGGQMFVYGGGHWFYALKNQGSVRAVAWRIVVSRNVSEALYTVAQTGTAD